MARRSDNVRNHPALKSLNIPRTGRGGIVGVMTTATLVIAGERGTFTDAQGRNGSRCCAPTIKPQEKMPALCSWRADKQGAPMTYMANGKQYIVIAVGGTGYPGELVAYTLPN